MVTGPANSQHWLPFLPKLVILIANLAFIMPQLSPAQLPRLKSAFLAPLPQVWNTPGPIRFPLEPQFLSLQVPWDHVLQRRLAFS